MKRSILITGAYGGMGKAAAKKLSDMGFRVFALDRSVEAQAEEDIIPIEADVTDGESIKSAYEKVCELTDSLFAIVHFAGIYMLDSLVEIDTVDFEKIFKVNLEGAFLINKSFFGLLKKGSRILITTSELAPLDPLPFTGIYAITKAALDKYAYSLRMELQLKGIDVSVLRAGAVDTGMLGASTAALDRFHEKTKMYSCNAARFKRIVEGVEARRVKPEKIAAKAVKILKKRHPRFSYTINRNPLLLILNALPRRFQFWIIKRILN
ncbi:MAG: SDR family NAD(P)-dependent oxidoreductase [Ruminococcaceae bacterium]|nr:SDR family NAD(P)-dependent oxidoreductase [Oscillospiraceae bacterium]